MTNSSHIEFRKIEPRDEDRLARFFDSVITHDLNKLFHPHPFTCELAYEISHYSGLDWYGGGFFCSLDSEELIAYGILRGWDSGYQIPSLGICVLPDFQRMGIGSVLMNIMILISKLRNSPAIRLKVYPENIDAINLYRSLGFEFCEELEAGLYVSYLKL